MAQKALEAQQFLQSFQIQQSILAQKAQQTQQSQQIQQNTIQSYQSPKNKNNSQIENIRTNKNNNGEENSEKKQSFKLPKINQQKFQTEYRHQDKEDNHEDYPTTAQQNPKKVKKIEHQTDANKEELDKNFEEPVPPFQISRNQLIRVASACQERRFAEDVDLLETMGGIKALEDGLCTNYKKGIRDKQEDIDDRIKAFGHNMKEVSKPKGFIALFFSALDDFTMKILIVAAFASIAIEVGTAKEEKRSTAWIEGFAILVAVCVCGSVTAINDYQKERQFQELNKVADERKNVTVLRNGKKQTLHMSKVLVGDIVELIEGMEIPADGIVLEASELTTDESAMTGETDPVKKSIFSECLKKRNHIIKIGEKNSSGSHDVPSPVILSGTKVLTGDGQLLITVVGDFSCVGKISKLLQTKDAEATPLQQKLECIARDIGNFGLISSIVIMLVLLIRLAIERIQENSWNHSEHWAQILQFILIGITVVVVAIPEGLPLAVTLSLAYSVKKMLRDKNLVRKLQACETMGGADCICSDKTGTLTQNKMTLSTWWNEELQEFEKYKDTVNINDYISANQKDMQELFFQSCAINSSADLRPDMKGSKTEIAILQLLDKFGEQYEKWRERYEILARFPFSSARKRMGVILKMNGKQRLLQKGASELVLNACDTFLSKKTGKIQPINDELLNKMKVAIKSMADNALRTIVLGYKELKGNEDIETKDRLGVFDIETKGLTLLGIFGIKDILREEVPGAVKTCQMAGIKVRMITGDNKDTARAIAKDCNILTLAKKENIQYQVIEGTEFIRLTGGVVCKECRTFECGCPRDADVAEKEKKKVRVDVIKNGEVFDKIYQDIDVMARSRPEDKYAMVVGLLERNHVVAVTGDGTNDAPALKRADVGFAMGIAGTEVAREAAAIILLDDNFKSIVAAVMWGRNIYDCIKKFLQFQLTVNIVAVGITLIGAAILKMEILVPIQMLWINLIMDTFASLALATEPPTEELLQRKPHNRDEYIISKKMFKHIIGQSIFQFAILLIFVFNGENFIPEKGDNFDQVIKQNKIKEFKLQWYLAKYSDNRRIYVRSGRERSLNGLQKEYLLVQDAYDMYSRHFTCIFNVFVWLQLFNFINARKLQDQLNVFEGLKRNLMFPVIVGFIIFAQALIIQFGGKAFRLYKYGLTVEQWFMCVGFGSLSLVSSFILKFFSEDKCFQLGKNKVNPLATNSKVLSLKGNRDQQSMNRKYSVLQGNQIRQSSSRNNYK
ncbi:hypothetical protein IMG5_055150 [Ichthyophthirius multifiliis]|uniref:P-type Ca(2+) transporter n=1 Tax=Ichthyophthirius multifiliis TaxID=5932 RepID=G0QN43_ICHMU|nr:hypothetical protein IMG5_055150 [Ichthyophthirius multifiliis]EGR33372.1 hypothetical protein IMG5_055150 [Ichthyophthirius multifiliis]|eukprot:XP_004037358.1 hypothetical protein IMG5_055150 [Ichthyophthirius multifiliis]